MTNDCHEVTEHNREFQPINEQDMKDAKMTPFRPKCGPNNTGDAMSQDTTCRVIFSFCLLTLPVIVELILVFHGLKHLVFLKKDSFVHHGLQERSGGIRPKPNSWYKMTDEGHYDTEHNRQFQPIDEQNMKDAKMAPFAPKHTPISKDHKISQDTTNRVE